MTFCPQLWNGFYINRNGDVYPCCHQKPTIVGNINESTLRKITNNAIMMSMREASLLGKLPCYGNCTLLNKEGLVNSNGSTVMNGYHNVKRLHISFGEACNIRCEMCSHPLRHAKSAVYLDPEVVIRNVDISSIEDFVIQGGEPLYVKPCLDFMRYLEDAGKQYTILTNGLLIDDNMAQRLASHARVVSISINGATKDTHEAVNRGSNFEKVLENIQRLRKWRGELKTEFTIFGRMTLTIRNVHEIPLFIRNFEKFGFDRINFGFVRESVPNFLMSHKDQLSNLRHGIQEALKYVDSSNIDILRLKQLNLIDAGTMENGLLQDEDSLHFVGRFDT